MRVRGMNLMVKPTYDPFNCTKSNSTIAGYTYTAIASLAFLDRLPESAAQSSFSWKLAPETSTGRETALTNLTGMIRWLLSRQLAYAGADDDEDDQGARSPQMNSDCIPPEAGVPSLAGISLNEAMCVGFNGRANKLADTCYCYWVPASLEVGSNMSVFV